MKALVGANSIDGTGEPVINDATIVINGDRVEAFVNKLPATAPQPVGR